MSDAVFVIRNQLGQFWTRAQEWVDGREPQRLLKFKHRDEALNQLVELSAKDIDLRGEILACETNSRGEPAVEASEHLTPTLAEKAAAEAANSDLAETETAESEPQGAAHSETDTGEALEPAPESAPVDDASEPPATAAVS
jgi:hypothetical protein